MNTETFEDGLATWQRYYLHTDANGAIAGSCETNDNRDQGVPSEYARWDVKYKDFEAMKKATGLSHVGCIGCEVSVYLDGKKV